MCIRSLVYHSSLTIDEDELHSGRWDCKIGRHFVPRKYLGKYRNLEDTVGQKLALWFKSWITEDLFLVLILNYSRSFRKSKRQFDAKSKSFWRTIVVLLKNLILLREEEVKSIKSLNLIFKFVTYAFKWLVDCEKYICSTFSIVMNVSLTEELFKVKLLNESYLLQLLTSICKMVNQFKENFINLYPTRFQSLQVNINSKKKYFTILFF